MTGQDAFSMGWWGAGGLARDWLPVLAGAGGAPFAGAGATTPTTRGP